MTVPRLVVAAFGLIVMTAACGGATSTAGPTVAPGTQAVSSSGPVSSTGTGSTSPPNTAPTSRPVPTPGRTPLPASTTSPTAPPAATTIASQPSATAIDVCALFTGDELATVTGHKFLSTTPGGEAGDPYGCEWDFEGPYPEVNWTISIGIWPNSRTYFEASKAYAAGTPVPGLGDDSFSAISDSVTVLSGETQIDVQYVNLSEDPGIDQVPITVAQDVIARLPH